MGYLIFILISLFWTASANDAFSTNAGGPNYRCLQSSETQSKGGTIAIAFFGMSRNLKLTLPSIQRHVFKVLGDANIAYDVFWYTTITRVAYHHKEVNGTKMAASEFIDPLEVRLLTLCRFSLIDQQAVREEYMRHFLAARGTAVEDPALDHWKDNFVSVRNIMGAFHTQIMIDDMISRHARATNITYDAVLAIRPDTAMIKDIDLPQKMQEVKRSRQMNVWWIPNYAHYKGLNDRGAFGPASAMSLYLRRGLQFRDSQFVGSGEAFIPLYAKQHNITIKFSEIRSVRVRANGEVAGLEATFSMARKHMNLASNDPDLRRCVRSNGFLNAEAC